MNPTQNLGIYFHIPFCRSKCPYCDFYSVLSRESIGEYVYALKDELTERRRISDFVDDKVILQRADSLYFGGGTPSLIGEKHIADIISCAKSNFTVDENAEITVEVNPSLSSPDEFFAGIKEAGVNRASIGLQSAVDGERRALGRISSAADAEKAVRSAQKNGITDISLDIMLGIPQQTKESLLYTLDFALSLGVTHLSCYMLQIEPGTFFYRRRDKLVLPNEDETADLYLTMCNELKKRGMRRYEISNFCFGDNVSRHNMKYWTLAPYLGIGAAAHSFYNGHRFYFEPSIRDFADGKKAVFDCECGGTEEEIMLLMRTDMGVPEEKIDGKKVDFVASLVKAGLLEKYNGRIRLTDSGCLVSNSVIAELI